MSVHFRYDLTLSVLLVFMGIVGAPAIADVLTCVHDPIVVKEIVQGDDILIESTDSKTHCKFQ